ncbi:MAG: UDP-N-acetylmuramoyl-L-alanyl-D-glutamate--2,6-diaminopimelate ligase [Lachnospiraceae bacterium]|nr:UDP-N-acetylmuramoyl-L-alanyl-D-glutamate--2,6-diaminopimelate ligase [Lachnospiraceae bacterium]
MILADILGRTEYRLAQGSEETRVTGLAIDSRQVSEGGLFVALTGSRTDGHEYIPQAVKAGAAVIVAERMTETPDTVTYVLVEDSRAALAKISAAWYGDPAKKLTVIGITGTKGKTTTAAMVRQILEAAGKKTGLIGTNGAFIDGKHYPTVNTTPESCEVQRLFRCMADSGCEYAVMEVSSQGLMTHRVDGFRFDYGIFTNISPDHIGPGEHEDFAQYLEYKSQLLRRSLVGIVNQDDAHYDEVVKNAGCRLVTFGMNHPADWTADHVDYLTRHGFMGIGFHLSGRDSFSVEVNIPGLFNVYNAMAAIALCETMGIGREPMLRALRTVTVDGRMEIVYASQKLAVLVDYAHNAVSMESLLDTLRSYDPGRLVCVFGCGGNRSKLRRYEMGEIGGKKADLSIITADNSRWEKVEDIMADIRTGMDKTGGKFVEIPDRRDAIFYSIEHAREGDIIAVIGKGHEDYQEICGVRSRFLDREEVEAALEKFGYRQKIKEQ